MTAHTVLVKDSGAALLNSGMMRIRCAKVCETIMHRSSNPRTLDTLLDMSLYYSNTQ